MKNAQYCPIQSCTTTHSSVRVRIQEVRVFFSVAGTSKTSGMWGSDTLNEALVETPKYTRHNSS